MKRHLRFVPYIRRYQPGDRGLSLRQAMRVEFFRLLGRPFYVLVQRDAANCAHGVMDSARTRRELIATIVACHHTPNGRTFRAWARRVGRYARGEKQR